jgi:hypothetical protein
MNYQAILTPGGIGQALGRFGQTMLTAPMQERMQQEKLAAEERARQDRIAQEKAQMDQHHDEFMTNLAHHDLSDDQAHTDRLEERATRNKQIDDEHQYRDAHDQREADDRLEGRAYRNMADERNSDYQQKMLDLKGEQVGAKVDGPHTEYDVVEEPRFDSYGDPLMIDGKPATHHVQLRRTVMPGNSPKPGYTKPGIGTMMTGSPGSFQDQTAQADAGLEQQIRTSPAYQQKYGARLNDPQTMAKIKAALRAQGH